ncbi:hypothetical protein PRIPAC_93857 [Pristionchus pacificus]|uniref:Uncharacterized protein n=1 Tax=Pristionchus pacificus TaxID=54126 RepID=A0A2A6CCK5_PRIPA|nr:hypothetical protein PRIPAC_93857 [Pristionchus pacificus]|eukprot:PDM75965.1 hypothetical protein PRIPAC_37638 [Pristionchus pacificus]
MDPLMENIPVNDPLFCSFLSTFDKFCQFLDDEAISLKRSLTKKGIRALRFPLNDDGTEESAMMKKVKSDAWDYISRCILSPEERSYLRLNRIVTVFLSLLMKKVPICNILYPIVPIVFVLIEKCSNKLWGVRFVSILFGHLPEFSLEFRNQFVSLLFDSLNSNRPPIRRVAAYSFGEMAKTNMVELKEIAISSLDEICRLMNRNDARREGTIVVTEVAVAAVINSIQFNSIQFFIHQRNIIVNCDEKRVGTGRMNEILDRFLSWFPLTGQSKECYVAYSFLLDLIDTNHPMLMGEPNSISPRLLYILVKSSCDSIDEWIRRSGLNADEQVTLRKILTSTN